MKAENDKDIYLVFEYMGKNRIKFSPLSNMRPFLEPRTLTNSKVSCFIQIQTYTR